jgi:GNAT superfamily N-acetyltransferase
VITSVRSEDVGLRQRRKAEYLRTLAVPTDGMWEGAVIAQAALWELHDLGQYAGYYCIDSNNCLLRFHLLEKYRRQAQAIFQWVISTHTIREAVSSTAEPFYLSLCLDMQTGISLHSYLFRDNTSMKVSPGPSGGVFRRVEGSESDDVIRFYRKNTEGPGEWIDGFLHTLIRDEALFGLYDGGTLVATGECIPSHYQAPYADLGMVVERSQRRRGWGSSMLLHLKEHCYAADWKPICACAAENVASKKAIEKAGFITEHRMVNLTLSNQQDSE